MLNVMFCTAILQASRKNGVYVIASICFSFYGDILSTEGSFQRDTFLEQDRDMKKRML